MGAAGRCLDDEVHNLFSCERVTRKPCECQAGNKGARAAWRPSLGPAAPSPEVPDAPLLSDLDQPRALPPCKNPLSLALLDLSPLLNFRPPWPRFPPLYASSYPERGAFTELELTQPTAVPPSSSERRSPLPHAVSALLPESAATRVVDPFSFPRSPFRRGRRVSSQPRTDLFSRLCCPRSTPGRASSAHCPLVRCVL